MKLGRNAPEVEEQPTTPNLDVFPGEAAGRYAVDEAGDSVDFSRVESNEHFLQKPESERKIGAAWGSSGQTSNPMTRSVDHDSGEGVPVRRHRPRGIRAPTGRFEGSTDTTTTSSASSPGLASNSLSSGDHPTA